MHVCCNPVQRVSVEQSGASTSACLSGCKIHNVIPDCKIDPCVPWWLQNVQPEKLFSRERAVEQLLGIIDGVSMQDNGRYIAWDGQDIPW